MQYFFEFDELNNVFRSSLEGQVTDDILLETYLALERWQVSRAPCRAVFDFSGVTTFDISSEMVRRLAARPPALGVESRVVFVAPKDLVYGLIRMFTILGEESRPNRHVVRSMEEAYELLGITSPQFTSVKSA